MTEPSQRRPDDPGRREEELAAWLVGEIARELGLDPETIDVQEPFDRYELGSRQALVLLGRLEHHLGRELSPTLIWSYPTIAQLARRLAEEGPAG